MTGIGRPTGAPFWGESLGIWDVYNLAGTSITYDGVETRGKPYASATEGSCTVTAGNEFLAWIDYRYRYMLAEDVGIVGVWTFEVLSGSGVLHLWDGQDPEFADFGNLPATPNDLGTIAVTGPGTYTLAGSADVVSDVVLRSGGAISGTDALPVVKVVVESGTIELDQIKMRYWPPDGPYGSFGTMPAEDMVLPSSFYHAEPEGGQGSSTTYLATEENDQPSWDDAHDAAQAAAAPANPTFSNNASSSTLRRVRAIYEATSNIYVGEDTLNYISQQVSLPAETTWLKRAADYADVNSPVPPGVEGVDWIRLPTEVAADIHSESIPGSYDAEWLNVVIENPGDSLPDGYPASFGVFTVTATDTPNPVSPPVFDYTTEGASSFTLDCWPGTTEYVSVPMPDADVVRITGRHSFKSGDNPPVHGGAYSLFSPRTVGAEAGGRLYSQVGSELQGVQWVAHFGVGQIWVPGLPDVTPPLRIRQRGDGLSIETTRLKNRASRQTTNRLRGFD